MYILFDIGGTKIRIAASMDSMTFKDPVIIDTPPTYEEGIAVFKKTVTDLASGENIKAIGGGIAGPFSQKKSALIGSPNLKDWIGKPFLDELKKTFNTPVYIENDSALVGLGEAVAGAGVGYDIVCYITVSTGVGGARIIRGKIDETSIGFEPGHQIIDAGKTLCSNCTGVYLGNYISGKATAKRFGKKAYEVTDDTLWEEELPKWLAYGLNNTIVHWSPDVVVLGGSMIVGDPAISVAATEKYLKEILIIFPELPVMKKAELADLGGLHGAMALIRQQG